LADPWWTTPHGAELQPKLQPSDPLAWADCQACRVVAADLDVAGHAARALTAQLAALR
jgi:hypothetical protein